QEGLVAQLTREDGEFLVLHRPHSLVGQALVRHRVLVRSRAGSGRVSLSGVAPVGSLRPPGPEVVPLRPEGRSWGRPHASGRRPTNRHRTGIFIATRAKAPFAVVSVTPAISKSMVPGRTRAAQ